MVPRIQTLYILVALAALAAFMVSFMPGMIEPKWFVLTGIPAVAAACILIAALVSGNRRERQRHLLRIALLALLVFSGLAYGAIALNDSLALDHIVELALPIVAYVGGRLALSAVTRDIKLIASVDRLR